LRQCGTAKIYYKKNWMSEEEILNLSHSGSKEYSDLFIRYSGEYKNEKYEGDGIYYYTDGTVYRGNFKASNFEGRGIKYLNPLTLTTDQKKNLEAVGAKDEFGYIRYSGEWKTDQFEGDGIYYYTDGDVYRGNFRADLSEGRGILYYNPSTLTDDQIRNLEAVGAKDTFGYIMYSGEYKDNKREGEGIYYFKNGEVYRGSFKGLREGRGIEYYNPLTLTTNQIKNLESVGAKDEFGYILYSGEWKMGKFEGEGSRYNLFSNHKIGFWKEYKYVGSHHITRGLKRKMEAPIK